MDIHERVTTAVDNLSPEEWEAAEAHAVDCPECAEILGLSPPAEEVVEPPRFRVPVAALKTMLALVALASFVLFGALFQAPETAEASDEAVVVEMARSRPAEDGDRAFKSVDTEYDVMGGGGGSGYGGRSLRRAGGSADAPPPPPAIPYREGQKVVRNAEVEIEVESYAAFYGKLTEIMTAGKGYLAGETKRLLPNGKTEATLTLRLPPEGFEALLAKFAELGTVRHQSVRTEDVTKAYIDLESRLKSKETLAERLRGILATAKGEVQELVQAEAHLAGTLEEIEKLKGEIRYYDNLTGFATFTVRIAEKEAGQPFEYVQTLAAHMALTVRDPEGAFAAAQKAVTDAGGQVVEARVDGQAEQRVTAHLRARVDAGKYPALRASLRALGHATADRVDLRKTPQGGRGEAALADAPLRKALASLDLTLAPPEPAVTRKATLALESADPEAAYQAARAAAEAASGRVLDGGLSGSTSSLTGRLRVQVAADQAAELLGRLKALGAVRAESVEHALPPGGAVLERADITLSVSTPAPLIAEEHGAVRVIRETVAGSWSGFLWSVEKMFVGASLATPWAVLGLLAWLLYRRWRRKESLANVLATPER